LQIYTTASEYRATLLHDMLQSKSYAIPVHLSSVLIALQDPACIAR
jgi:hypothetical protein